MTSTKPNRRKPKRDHGATLMAGFITFNLVFWIVAAAWRILQAVRP